VNSIHFDVCEAQRQGFSNCVVPEFLHAGIFSAIIGKNFVSIVFHILMLRIKIRLMRVYMSHQEIDNHH
jgi:hypothetical protein